MNIREAQIIDEQTWDEFVTKHPNGSFLQLWAWGQMQLKRNDI